MKLSVIALLLFVCISSCGAPDKTPAPTKRSDTPAAVTPDTAASPSQPDQSTIKFFLEGEDLLVPPYGLEKIKALKRRINWYEDTAGGDGGVDSLDQKAYDSLSFREKFTYHMIHPEGYSQLCDALPEHKDEPDRIFAFLPNPFGEFHWSDSQLAFFKNNRDSVDALMKDCIIKEGRIGSNFRDAIVEMNATEMIPVLIDAARKETKGHYSLTVLLLLMKHNNYSEFLNSSSNKKLYSKEYDEVAEYLVYNKANEDLIIQRATNFYNGLAAK